MKTAPPLRFVNRFSLLVVILALMLPFLLVPQVQATKKSLASGAVVWTESPVGWQCVITTPSLAVANADTAVIPLDVSKRLFSYAGANGVPTYRVIYGVMTADSCAVETWVGPTAADAAARVFKLNAMANQNFHLTPGTQKANEFTLYPFPFWNLYVINKAPSGSAKVAKLLITIPRPLVTHLPHNQF